MSHHTHFTTEERIKSSTLHELGYKNCEIAKIIGKSESALSREFKRNANPDGSYSPQEADKMYHERRMNCGHKPILENEDAKKYVKEKLEVQWPPEHISERAKLKNKPFSLSYNTIYGGMENGLLPKQLKIDLQYKCNSKKEVTHQATCGIMEVRTQPYTRRRQDEPLYPFYHRRAGVVKSIESAGTKPNADSRKAWEKQILCVT